MNNVRDELSSFQRRADRIDLAPRNRARPGAASGRHASDAEVPLPMMFSDDEEAIEARDSQTTKTNCEQHQAAIHVKKPSARRRWYQQKCNY